MKKIALLFINVFFLKYAYADISLNENILKNCKIDSSGIMHSCSVREERIKDSFDLRDNKFLKFKYKIDYTYSCKSVRLTDINIVNDKQEPLAAFRYDSRQIIVDSNSNLFVKDFAPLITPRIKYDRNCKLQINKIEKSLSESAEFYIKEGVCSIKRLNDLSFYSDVMLSFSSTLTNNIVLFNTDQIDRELNKLKSYLLDIKTRFSHSSFHQTIDQIVGNDHTFGSINYILKNFKDWEQGSFYLTQNLNILYNNMQSVQVAMKSAIESNAFDVYEKLEIISKYSDITSILLLNSNLNYEYNKLLRKNTDAFKEADYCYSLARK
jgi:hypothetical protein